MRCPRQTRKMMAVWALPLASALRPPAAAPPEPPLPAPILSRAPHEPLYKGCSPPAAFIPKNTVVVTLYHLVCDYSTAPH